MIYGQRGAKWKNKKIGNSNSSIGDYGCTICCLAMLAGITPDDVNTRLAGVNGYLVDKIIWAKVKQAIPWLEFEWRGYQYDNNKVKKAIADNGGCLVEVDFDGSIATPRDRHWVLFIGNQRMCDPWTGRECSTSKYKIKTGYSIIKVYNRPEENMTKQEEAILKFVKESGATEGDIRQGIAYVKEGTVAKLEKDVEDLKTSLKSLEKSVKKINLRLGEKEDELEISNKDLASANKTNTKLSESLAFYKPYKKRYEDKCLETADKLNSIELFKLLITKLFPQKNETKKKN